MNTSRAFGVKVLKEAVANIPEAPGVYRMLNIANEPIYVGKAKNLKRRVASYINISSLSHRIQRMIASTVSIEIISTSSEVEALLLESNLIKRLKPKYNIILRDDKSFPYILISKDHEYPRVAKYRGIKHLRGEYFGPFASAGAVDQAVNALHRAFPLRSCTDSMFSSRTRPCLQYQIKRCVAPCVGRIDKAGYSEIVSEARAFLSGHSQAIKQRLTRLMTDASDTREYEIAAVYRDRIRALAHIHSSQGINLRFPGDADVIAVFQAGGQSCVQIFFFRNGQNYGNRPYYPRHSKDTSDGAILAAFLGQFYSKRVSPPLLLINCDIDNRKLLEEALSAAAPGQVRIRQPKRGEKAMIVLNAERNAKEALARKLSERSNQEALMHALTKTLNLTKVPHVIEVYDNSHISGTNAVGAMIAADSEGFIKKRYRKFNIRGDNASSSANNITPGDDYGMLREVLRRRFARLLKGDRVANTNTLPDLVLIDGGPGQLSVASDVFAELSISKVSIAAIAKGPDRNAGLEKIYLSKSAPIQLDSKDPVLHFVQRLRDEAHRFAISSHRARRAKSTLRSELDIISGIGLKRKKALLQHFGSARGISQAGVADLEQVNGISKVFAQRIYTYFNDPS